MLSKNNTIKITDFGIARSISDSISRVSMRHASSGTMVYMSPQQSSGARSSSTDDIYALGATIYDLLTGKPPFYSGNIQHQLENITPPRMADRRAELERHGAPIPEAWEQAIASCLEKEPARRPQSVQELAQRLGLRVLGPLPTAASAPAPAAVPYERTLQDVTPVSTLERTMPAMPAPAGVPGYPTAQPAYQTAPPPTSYPPYQTQQPPYQPSPGFFTPDKIKWISILGGCAAGLAVVAGLIMMLGRGHGSVVIATTPPGATATIGDQKKTTPATFDEVDAGHTTVSLALDGYDPVQIPTDVTKNEKSDLGLTPLKRSTGTVAVTVLPKTATASLRLVQSDVANEPIPPAQTFPASSPWQAVLNSGKYELTATDPSLGNGQSQIVLKRGDAQQVVLDLIRENNIHALAPDEAAAVVAGQPVPDKFKQDPAAKARLTSYYQKTFQGYLKANEFDLAQTQLKSLSDLGVDTTAQQKQIDNGRLVAQYGQGTLKVDSEPRGAAVTVDGKTQPAPAVFQKILAGSKTISVTMGGYEPVQLPTQIDRDGNTDVGTVKLTRNTGSVEITAIPRKASSTLRLVHSESPNESASTVANFSGPDTYTNTALGTGTYSITSSGEGFPSTTQTIEVKKGDHLQVSVDLVKQDALHLLAPDQAAVVAGDQPIPDAMKQNPAAKSALTSYYQQTFQGYLQLKEFKLAETH